VLAESGRGHDIEFRIQRRPGLGDQLLAAVLRGEKTATSSLAVGYLSGEPLLRIGQGLTLVDHDGRPHVVVETVRVRIIPLNLVGDDVAHDEGEGFANATEWRRGHEAFWADVADLVRDAADPDWRLREAARGRALVPPRGDDRALMATTAVRWPIGNWRSASDSLRFAVWRRYLAH
jgi:uncharacterized protein YhfF